MRLLGAAGLPMISIALCHGSVAYADEFFDIDHIENQGRSVAVEFADLNGDARTDLLVVALLGIPPEEKRSVRVYLQKPDGSLPRDPDHTIEVPHWSAVYDVADLKESPGQELVPLERGLRLHFSPGRVARAPRVPQIRGPRTGGRRGRTGQYVEAAGGRRSRRCGAIGARSSELVRNAG